MNTSINLRVALYLMLSPLERNQFRFPGEFLKSDDEHMQEQLRFIASYIKDKWKLHAV